MLRYAGGAPVLANPEPGSARAHRSGADRWPSASSRRSASTTPGCRSALRDGDVLTLLAISPQFANAVTLKGHVAQPLRYPFTPGHAHPRPDPRSRRAHLARLLSAQEPARAGDRRRRTTAHARRARPRRRPRRAAAAGPLPACTEQTRNERDAVSAGRGSVDRALPESARTERGTGNDRPIASERGDDHGRSAAPAPRTGAVVAALAAHAPRRCSRS